MTTTVNSECRQNGLALCVWLYDAHVWMEWNEDKQTNDGEGEDDNKKKIEKNEI